MFLGKFNTSQNLLLHVFFTFSLFHYAIKIIITLYIVTKTCCSEKNSINSKRSKNKKYHLPIFREKKKIQTKSNVPNEIYSYTKHYLTRKMIQSKNSKSINTLVGYNRVPRVKYLGINTYCKY